MYKYTHVEISNVLRQFMLCSLKIVTAKYVLSRPKIVGYKVAAENLNLIAVSKVHGQPYCGMDAEFSDILRRT